ncbi:hypothetical protein AAVH_25539 [Aphelenchoides avenae]|nr:hypothetical protein AAVH_25539 [Aphelenchus avenae]
MADQSQSVAHKPSVSSDASATDLRDMYNEANLKLLKIAFGISWCVDLVLCLLVVFVIGAACFAPVAPNNGTLSTLIIFVLVFAILTTFLVLYKATKHFVLFIMADIFALQQFLCVAFMAFALFTNEHAVMQVAFWNDPITWVEGHSSVALAFALVFLPIFVLQLVLLTKYAYEMAPFSDESVYPNVSRKQQEFYTHPSFYFPY